jgi:hypothetical protein
VPFGSGLGGSSALTVALAAAIAAASDIRFTEPGRVAFVRDVETRVLGKPAGTQDYYPPLEGGLHRLEFETGDVRPRRREVDPARWLRHLTVYDTGAAHSSGMNNWEIFRARMEGDHTVAGHLDSVRDAALEMSEAVEAEGLPRDGRGARPRVGGAPAARAGRLVAGHRGGDLRVRRGGCLGGQGVRRGGRRMRRHPVARVADRRRPRGARRLDSGRLLLVAPENRGLELNEV